VSIALKFAATAGETMGSGHSARFLHNDDDDASKWHDNVR
jgi:hypothetical protein